MRRGGEEGRRRRGEKEEEGRRRGEEVDGAASISPCLFILQALAPHGGRHLAHGGPPFGRRHLGLGRRLHLGHLRRHVAPQV